MVVCRYRYIVTSALDFFNREEECRMKIEKPQMSAEKPQSKLLKIGILVVSLIVGVILALFTINTPH